MSNMIAWIQAEGERGFEAEFEFLRQRREKRREEVLRDDPSAALTVSLPAHQFPATGVQESAAGEARPSLSELQDRAEEREREQRRYRGRTVAMLRKYLRYSLETGRVPSLMGSEFFRMQVTAYTSITFEDRAIFVYDMEKCLNRLDEFSRQLIARHVLQEHDQQATSRLLHCSERTVRAYVPIALDLLTEILLEVGLMEPLFSNRENSCQGGKTGPFSASDWEQGK